MGLDPATTNINMAKFKLSVYKRAAFVIVLILVLAGGFLGGILFDKSRKAFNVDELRQLINLETNKPGTVDFKLFWEAWNLIHEKYVDKDKLNTQNLVYGAVEGMINAAGDPFTNFVKPELNKKFQVEIKGEFSGVGMEIGMRKNQLTVISPIKDSPADKAGIKADDKILKINEKDTGGLTVEEAVSFIRGKKGTPVKLTIARNGLAKTKEFTIIRDVIKIPTITLKFIGDNQKIAHLQIHSFNQNVETDFRKAARQILSSGADRIILDIRNNPGGLLDSAVHISSWFLNNNDVVTIEKFGDGKEEFFRAANIGSLKHLPLVILVNKGSASASEILAGALKDNRGIKVIGEKTFGKGSVQEVFNLAAYGATIKITIAKWLTPNGASINDNGISPDILVERKDEEIENEIDSQLEKAVDFIKNL